jgi:hypothetical protein
MLQVKRGKSAAGEVARAVAGAEAIEIKATVPGPQIAAALAHFGMSADNDEERHIYFFDTPQLDGLKAGVIARARRVVGDVHDSTVKFRPVDPAQVDRRWHKYRDFKIEVDASEKGTVKSASFSMPVEKGLIKRVAAGKKPIRALFSDEQIEFLLAMAATPIDHERVVVLGPVRAHRWHHEDPACPWPITAELWRREDGERLMELSIKAPIAQAAAAIGGFMAYLAELGAERDADEQAKTRWVLDYHAAKLRAAAASPNRPPVASAARRARAAATGAAAKGAGNRAPSARPRRGAHRPEGAA